jgi:hypothetical protein
VINPETRTEVLHFSPTFLISKKKKAEAAIIAIVPTKKVNAVAWLMPKPWLASNRLDAVIDNNIKIEFNFPYSVSGFSGFSCFNIFNNRQKLILFKIS